MSVALTPRGAPHYTKRTLVLQKQAGAISYRPLHNGTQALLLSSLTLEQPAREKK